MHRYRQLVGVVLLLSACGGDSTTGPNSDTLTPTATSVELSHSEVTFDSLAATTQFTATVKDQNGQTMADATISWFTSNSLVTTISSTGLVTSVANGQATITATSGSASATASVTVAATLSTSGSWTSIAAGNMHACGVTTANDGYCWGDNVFGELGSGSASSFPLNIPVEVSGGHAWASITAGSGHACGTTTAGNGYCWGYNGFGGLGDGSVTDSNIPVEISGGHTWASITAGGGLTCGITTAGGGYCWGFNGFGELGNGLAANSSIPVEISDGHTWASISVGNSYTCGVTTAGSGYCWGFNDDGQLGNGTTDLPPGLTPVEISGEHTWASISVRQDHTCGVTIAEDGYCWGSNGVGQIGDGEATVTSRLTPVEVITPWTP